MCCVWVWCWVEVLCNDVTHRTSTAPYGWPVSAGFSHGPLRRPLPCYLTSVLPLGCLLLCQGSYLVCFSGISSALCWSIYQKWFDRPSHCSAGFAHSPRYLNIQPASHSSEYGTPVSHDLLTDSEEPCFPQRLSPSACLFSRLSRVPFEVVYLLASVWLSFLLTLFSPSVNLQSLICVL